MNMSKTVIVIAPSERCATNDWPRLHNPSQGRDLPSFPLLLVQWRLTKLAAMCGAAEILDEPDPEDDQEDGDLYRWEGTTDNSTSCPGRRLFLRPSLRPLKSTLCLHTFG